jgi:hypothetical protein
MMYPASARMPNEAEEEVDDESFVPEDFRDYSSAISRSAAFVSLTDHMDGIHAVDEARREHEEELANWPHTYDTYLSTFA